MKPALVMIVAYLLGSVPFGYLIVRARLGADVRETGSGGTGATNVSRRAGKVAGVLTLVLDALKGGAAVLIARWILIGDSGQLSLNADWWIALAAILVTVGHMFPVWLGFRGGKGVATSVGVFLVLAPTAVAFAAAAFLLIVWLTRYVSLGSIVAAAAIPLFLLSEALLISSAANRAPVLTASIAAAALIIFAHRANIGRLRRGTESKFS